ncbi:nucleotide-binding protein [Massilia sp. S19_KUP03_FR1]|uniref:nucleotide-binding protein n=1 Tax=Massilia sp. S19_KUP03_FR1 TaxID=3025503 RepID=UPI002FCD6606
MIYQDAKHELGTPTNQLVNQSSDGTLNNSKVFIASSTEGLNIAYDIQTNLAHDADCTAWPQGIFELSVPPIDSLIKQLDNSDFAIFVFSPDDEIKMRGNTTNSVRDNVLFELGLFIGRLGKNRCFIVAPDAHPMRIASDLVGVTPATYSSKRDPAEMAANLGPACQSIRRAIRTLGRFNPDVEPGHIPVTESDSYDDVDKKLILQQWLNTSAQAITAYKYDDLDNKLKLDRGTVRRFLSEVLDETKYFELLKEGGNFFMLKDLPLHYE